MQFTIPEQLEIEHSGLNFLTPAARNRFDSIYTRRPSILVLRELHIRRNKGLRLLWPPGPLPPADRRMVAQLLKAGELEDLKIEDV